MKFFPADWRSEPRLRMCSLAARGLWMELIAVMHEAEPYGHLLVEGRIPTEEQLVVLAGADLKAVRAGMKELQANAVFSTTAEGVVFSRRMVKDDAKAKKDKEAGRKGGNPNLVGVNPPVNQNVKRGLNG